MGVVSTPLPYDAEVEYIQTDGNAFIDTGIKCASTVNLDLNIYIPNHASIAFWVFGSRISSSSGQLAFLNNISANSCQWRFGNSYQIPSGALSQGLYNFKTNKNTLTVGGRTITATNNNFTSNNNIYLLTLNVNGTPATANTAEGARLYPSKMYNSDGLVRDYIAVRKDGVGYLYDKVSGELFGNANSEGAFSYGADKN